MLQAKVAILSMSIKCNSLGLLGLVTRVNVVCMKKKKSMFKKKGGGSCPQVPVNQVLEK
jgi:hypothetical protein